jgi:ATP-dependent Clp protease, protease subunit|tara:strand:- start:238 stop:888 length:651 start_codon:yes stop_codon:yes gene_type:complete
MARDIYGNYDEEQVKTNTPEEEVYYEDDLEKKHLYKEIEFAVDVEDSVVYIVGEIEDFGLYDFMVRCRAIIKNREEGDSSPINVIIDSVGGDVYEMFGIIDYIESLERNSDIKVNTICRGKAMSAAAMILACGTGKRLASKRSTIMIHEGSSMQAGKSSDLKAAHKYNAHLEDMANAILGEKTIKDKKFWSEQTKTDLYLSSKDAQKLGVIDGIIH